MITIKQKGLFCTLRFFFLIVLVSLFVTFSANLYGNPFEKGDAIYRDGAYGFGHVALYDCWLSNYPPGDWTYHVLEEANGTEVAYTTYQDFLDSGNSWGVRCCALTAAKRNTIVALARGSRGLPYSFIYYKGKTKLVCLSIRN
ncbi:MAG: hypothetical protein P9M03_03300 [Candidatus Theseobacter exili]|nr:hypothetical protein [Candidatus Theseobacter exili]